MLMKDHVVLPAIHSFIDIWNEPVLASHRTSLQSALWLVLVFRPAEGRRLSELYGDGVGNTIGENSSIFSVT